MVRPFLRTANCNCASEHHMLLLPIAIALIWFTETRAAAQRRGGARGCEQPRWRGGCRTHVRSHVATFNLQLCKSRGVRCQASASYHRVAPQAITCRTRSTPLRLSDVSRARHARTRRSTTYHSIYINSSNNSSFPSFLSTLLASPRLACFLCP